MSARPITDYDVALVQELTARKLKPRIIRRETGLTRMQVYRIQAKRLNRFYAPSQSQQCGFHAFNVPDALPSDNRHVEAARRRDDVRRRELAFGVT